MFDKAKRWALQQGYEKLVPEVLNCPTCRASIPRPPFSAETGFDIRISCPQCGWDATVDSLIDRDRADSEIVTEQPRDSRIELRVEPNLTRTWVFPASKKFNFLLIFGILWSGFVGLFTFLMIASDESSFDGMSRLGGMLFLIPFWLVGLGVSFGGLWMMLASQEITLKPDGRIYSVRRFLGVTFRKKFETGPQTRIKRVVAYTQNDSPVYTVEISNDRKNRIRLSSTISDDEKSWMLGQLRSALGKEDVTVDREAVANPGYASAQRLGGPVDLQEVRSDGLTIRRLDSKSFEVSLGFQSSIAFVIVAIVCLAASLFLGWQSIDGFLGLSDSGFAVFDWIFIIVPGVMAAIFGITAFVIFTIAVGMGGRKRTLKFYQDFVVADPEWPIGAKGGKFEKSRFERVVTSRTGHSNGDPRYSVKLLGAGIAVPICRFRDAREAQFMADWVREWLEE